LRNSSAFALKYSTTGDVGKVTRKQTDYGPAADATRLKYRVADLFLPGDTLSLPVGPHGTSVSVSGSPADEFYALASILAPLVPAGKFAGVATVFTGLVSELQADTAQYEDCKRSSSSLQRLSCKPLLVRNVGFALGRAGVGALTAVVKGGASEIIGTFLTVVTGIRFAYNRVSTDPALLHSPTLRIAALGSLPPPHGGSGLLSGWACKPGENFSIEPGYFVTHSPWRIAMSHNTQLAIWRALPDGEFGTPHGGSSVPDTRCRVAASVVDDALVSWGETTTNDIVLPNEQVNGYVPGPRLGRFSCSGTTQHPTHTNFEITHESCVDRSGRFGFVGVKFVISGSP